MQPPRYRAGTRAARALLLWLSLVAVPAGAQYQYITNWSTIGLTLTGYTGPGGDVVIPTAIEGLPVTGIGDSAFDSCVTLTSITIPDSVTAIGNWAFQSCSSLTNARIGNGVTVIGDEAFDSCVSLRDVTMGRKVVYIGALAFDYCVRLGSIVIPDSVANVSDLMFQSCTSLTNLVLGRSVTNIGYRAFDYCVGLVSLTLPRSLEYIGESAFRSCASLATVYALGDAPSHGPSVFLAADHATVYYLPGTTGWGATFCERPAVLWDPRAAKDTTFGLGTNGFGFTIVGASNLVVVVEACADLVSPLWQALRTNTLVDGSSYFSDPDWGKGAGRFYRFRAP